MPITITETVERSCCHPVKDFKEYHGRAGVGQGVSSAYLPGNKVFDNLRFCVHCGQVWQYYREPGDMEADWHPLTLVVAFT